jgi:hypothetical protein
MRTEDPARNLHQRRVSHQQCSMPFPNHYDSLKINMKTECFYGTPKLGGKDDGRTLSRWIILLIVSTLMIPATAAAEFRWGATLFGARLTINSFGDTLFGEASYEDAHLVGLALSRKIGTYKDLIGFEIEGQAVKHFGDQDHEEFNAVIMARWRHFPWDRFLDTSLAVGEGISYAAADPVLENKGRQWLNYILLELAFAPPSRPRWEAVIRIHHRSGVFGLYNGVRDASNGLGVGIRYRF